MNLFRLRSPLLCCALLIPAMSHAAIVCVEDDLSGVPERLNIDFPTEIQPIFSVACANCHTNGGQSGGLNMDIGAAYGNLVNVAASNANAEMDRITPDDPQASFLFKKTNCTNLNSMPGNPYGLRMPRSGPPYLSAADQARILDWIRQGAPAAADPQRIYATGFDGHAAPPN